MKRLISDGLDSKIRPLAVQVMSRITPTDSELTSLTCGNYIFYLCALTLILFFTGLGERDLWAPVEPRYAEVVRVMFAKSEWIVPTVNGELYTDKPILYFWLALIVSKIAGGVTEWTVRLPAALGAIGFVMATYLVGRDFFSARVGIIAGAVLATSIRVIWEARWAHIDMLFGFLFLLTIYFGARSLLGKGGKREILWAYVFMALAVLAKGLIGIVLPALTLAAFAIVRRDWRIIVDAKLQLGIPHIPRNCSAMVLSGQQRYRWKMALGLHLHSSSPTLYGVERPSAPILLLFRDFAGGLHAVDRLRHSCHRRLLSLPTIDAATHPTVFFAMFSSGVSVLQHFQ